ncbi:hypothetical protein MPL3356_390189 [Mesorhizobium plurifarium]|uniref:Uncharacterized protein n=1 Tax=Mesorhizobium plurifarium TaxID=69974 RepID=A0A090GVX4_MESPL|nr:hypothetical protein MPL3356_390189 [Mesorhizobium plurifarium]CDX41146.1 hypothetical protein MPLDJ20_320035 [Mesorhizobium plurifarium]CDX61690.1 hypothetical protein MPL3365_70038 [Mesorhizobium plurifarium]
MPSNGAIGRSDTARHVHSASAGHVHLSRRNPAVSGGVGGAGSSMALLSIGRLVERRARHSLFHQHMRLARGYDEGLPRVVRRNVAADRPAAGAQGRAMQRAAGIAPLAGQQFDGLFGVGYVADRAGKPDGHFDRPGKPSLDHR